MGGSDEGYRVRYGGGRVDQLDRHPEISVRRRYISAAAGAYQFLPSTWREASSQLGLADFGPPNQDQAALYLMRKRGALAAFDARGLTQEVLSRLAPEWASLPADHGGSDYGQPVKTVAELQSFFRAELRRLRPSGVSGTAWLGLPIDHAAPFVVADFQQIGSEQLFNFLMQKAAVHVRRQIEFDQGIVDREAPIALLSRQTQQLPIQRQQSSGHICRVDEPAIGTLHHLGNEQQIHQLAHPAEPEGEQPKEARERFAVVEAMDAAKAHQGQAPKSIADGQVAPLVSVTGRPGSSKGARGLEAAHGRPSCTEIGSILRPWSSALTGSDCRASRWLAKAA